jgi:hypothetical protein
MPCRKCWNWQHRKASYHHWEGGSQGSGFHCMRTTPSFSWTQTTQEVSSLLNILTQFGEATGLRLNWTKCSVAPIRCNDINLDHILEPFAGQRVNFPITYLGLPLTLGRLKVVHLQGIVDKARKRLAGWQGRLLNPSGRRELVRSVLSAIPIYMLTAIKPPKQLLDDLDKIRRCFLWQVMVRSQGGNARLAGLMWLDQFR